MKVILVPQEPSGLSAPELVQSRERAIYLGFIIILALDLICLWRLAIMISAVLRFRLWAVRWRQLICWCFADVGGEVNSLLVSPSLLPSRNLQRKLVFHAVIFLAVNLSVPGWAYLFWATYRGAYTLRLPPLLYYLQLMSEPLVYIAIALVLDMWLTVAEFHPDRLVRVWRGTVLLSSLGFVGLLGYVIFDDRRARTATEVAKSLPCKIFVLYGAAVLLTLALSFLISGCMIQRRIINVFGTTGPAEQFAWINVVALVRVNLVTLVCLVSFVLRSLDIAYLIDQGIDYPQRLIRCGRLLCVGRWLAEVLPILVLLYLMRGTGDTVAMRRLRRYDSLGSTEDGSNKTANNGQGPYGINRSSIQGGDLRSYHINTSTGAGAAGSSRSSVNGSSSLARSYS